MSWLDDILVVMPFGELTYSRYFMGLAVNPDFGRIITAKRLMGQQGIYPHQTLNDMVKLAMQRDDWKRMIVLEHDHEFPVDVFRRHAKATADIYAALYVLRDTKNPLPVIFQWDQGRHNALRPNAAVLNRMLTQRGQYDMDCVPLGCTSISREVFEKWPSDLPYFSSYSNPQGSTISHDIYFCRVAQDNGFQPVVDTSFRVSHFALTPVDDGYFVKWWNEVGAAKMQVEGEKWIREVKPLKGGVSRICVPHTKDGLKRQTEKAAVDSGLGVQFVEMVKENSYWVTMAALWDQRETVITLEQDIVPVRGQMQELLDCPEPWCAYAYEYPPFGLYAGMGCTKFSKELMERFPDALIETGKWSDSKHPPMHWCRVDGWLKQYLTDHGAEQHVHGVVEHLHNGHPSHDCVESDEPALAVMRV